ncbi:uncharacterized protein LOC119603706 [Lucilia sericata]|uniref:uncharacterized protein LOC119603706 n=1 Tax=Lucilia sericata TaxID=13632 RepID=UPI0018A7EA93|nr:uncharacterized protein LOC119603706 [Lucilia sericata]
MRLVLGDFNAHNQLWHSSLGEDQRGALLAEQIDESTFCTLNDDAPTRIMGTCASSPDITIASASLINYATWRAVVSLGSDHLPIIVCLDRPNDFIVSERRQYVNQKKADWYDFREFTERIFSDLNFPSPSERKFRETVISAAARFIPAGRISVVRPHFPAEAARLADERDDIRNTNQDPRLTQLNIEIRRLVNEDKRKRCLDHLKNCNLSSGVSKLWSTVRSLSNPTKKDDRVAIKFADIPISGLNQQRPCERTVLVALDLSKAFDTVSHATLFEDILQSTMPNNTKRWIVNYLSGRQSFVEFRDRRSKPRRVKQGVPQGGVLSPLLFNFYLSKLPAPPQGVEVISYADDCTIMTTGHNIDELCVLVNGYLHEIHQFFTARNLQLSPAKSSTTLFTTWTKEVNLNLGIVVDGVQIPTVHHPKILGVTFDSLFTSPAHATAITHKLRSRNKVLKALAGSTWGMDKETLLATYKTIGRSVVNYAAPVWSPSLSDTQWRNIQSCQNAALRTVTGCLQITTEHHLHEETKILPVKEHNVMLTKQFLLGCHRRSHPNFNIIQLDTPPKHNTICLVLRYWLPKK